MLSFIRLKLACVLWANRHAAHCFLISLRALKAQPKNFLMSFTCLAVWQVLAPNAATGPQPGLTHTGDILRILWDLSSCSKFYSFGPLTEGSLVPSQLHGSSMT